MLEVTDLPPQILPAVDAFANGLAAHLRNHRDTSLEVHEQGALDAWRAEAGAVLTGVVTAATTGADPRRAAITECLSTLWRCRPAQRWRRRSVETRLGGLTFTRTRYRCAPCART